MILLIDNYDSFTFNLFHFLGDVGARCEVWRNDKITVADALARQPEAIVLSPGPCTPNEAGICLDLITAAAGKIPILGVCLGHQAIGQAFGGAGGARAGADARQGSAASSTPATDILEGTALAVQRDALPQPDRRSRARCPTCWCRPPGPRTGWSWACAIARCRCSACSSIPESIASQHGHELLANFLAIARGTNAPARAA